MVLQPRGLVSVLTDALRPGVFWSTLKRCVRDERFMQLLTFCEQLKMIAKDGKQRATEAAKRRRRSEVGDERGHPMSEIIVYGTMWCPDCRRAKQFLRNQRNPFSWVDIERDPAGLTVVEQVNAGKHNIPAIVFPDDSVLVEPTNAALARKLGINWITTHSAGRALRRGAVAGDVRHGATAQVASAAGEGAAVILMVRGYLKRLGDAREQTVTTAAGSEASEPKRLDEPTSANPA
jgi:glutaredoxin